MIYTTLPKIPEPPILHPNEINAMYWQMRNNGQYYIPQLGGHPVHIDDWKAQEIDRARK